MSRPYSDKLLVHLASTDKQSPGINLGKACINAQLPIMHLAEALNVSRWTLHKWFRGENVASRFKADVESAYEAINTALQNNILPARERAESKKFIEENIRK